MNLLDEIKLNIGIIDKASDCPLYDSDIIKTKIKEAVFINNQNVVDYVLAKPILKMEDIPFVMPPFPTMWVENRISQRYGKVVFGMLFLSGNGKNKINESIAVLFVGSKSGSHFLEAYQGNVFHFKYNKEGKIIPFFENDSIINRIGRHLGFLNKEGKEFLVYDEKKSFSRLKNLNEKIHQLKISDDDVNRLCRHEIVLAVNLLTLSFMNCKNISLNEEIHQAPQVNFFRNRRPPPENPMIKCYTLSIEPIKKIISSKNRGNDEFSPRSLHICRGHFKDFSHGAGLFGKLKGQYWWPMQTRGHKEYGSIKKDYAIKV